MNTPPSVEAGFSTLYVVVGILLMVLVTYLPRVLPLLLVREKIRNRYVLAFLRYVPTAVLTALCIPSVFSSTDTFLGAALGFAVAVFTSFLRFPLWLVAFLSVLLTYGVETLLWYLQF